MRICCYYDLFILVAFSWCGSTATAFTSQSTPATTTTTTTRQRRPNSSLYASVLIVQNKGGGHGELGYQLAKVLQQRDDIDKITILQDQDADYETEPFKSYASDLEPNADPVDADMISSAIETESIDIKKTSDGKMKKKCKIGINAIPMSTKNLDWIDGTFMQNMLGGRDAKYDYVFDNCSKNSIGAYKALVDCVSDWEPGTCQMYVYVSSAGMYQPQDDVPFPMPESTTPIKESAGQNQFDQYVLEKGLPLVSFRPQYIYGPKSNKHTYIDYYFDYLVQGAEIPIPGDGQQLVSLTNAEDVASLLASSLDNIDAAVEQRYFNCGTDRLVSYQDVAYACAEAAGIPVEDVQIISTGSEKGKGFPFRATNFYIAPDTVKSKLGWTGANHTLKDDLKSWYYEGYKTRKSAATTPPTTTPPTKT
mmetsp:Transcript_39849/g.40360  ORF Transcript_39849/g.40360 Transcript_39849/m.40360 type:complete len:421 (+) Transcript_39849:73-1335(+)